MAISLNDYADVKAAQEAASAASAAVAAQEPASAASGAFVPPNNNNITPPSGAASPNLINQAWEGVKPYLNPVHYNAGGPQDFTNLDVTSTLAHGLVEGGVGLGLASRIKRELSGEAAAARQFKRQNDLSERRISINENALAEAQNVKDVEQKVAAQAAGKPAPQQRIEPTLGPEPTIGGVGQEPTMSPAAPPADANAPVAPKVLTPEEMQYKSWEASEARKAAEHEAEQRRKEEKHQKDMAVDKAKKAEVNIQKSQGKAFNEQDNTILSNQKEAQMKAAAAEQGAQKIKPVPPKPAPVAEKFVPPISSNPAETALTPEQRSARGWLEGQWGGAKKYFEGVQEIHGGVPPSYNPEKGQHAIGKDAHQVIMDWRKANIEGPKVNLTYDMKKVMKGAGGLAILTAIPGFAEAAQKKDVGKMTDLFTDFFVLPFAQSRGLNENEDQELAKRRYEGAVGGGRGIAPPSAYLR